MDESIIQQGRIRRSVRQRGRGRGTPGGPGSALPVIPPETRLTHESAKKLHICSPLPTLVGESSSPNAGSIPGNTETEKREVRFRHGVLGAHSPCSSSVLITSARGSRCDARLVKAGLSAEDCAGRRGPRTPQPPRPSLPPSVPPPTTTRRKTIASGT